MNNQNINPKSLKGRDLFNRSLELMNKLTPINESVINASLEFVKRAPNGLVYTIIRENHKYFIKSTDKSEFKISDLQYTGGLQNKMSEAYSSYEEALKHLNMKFQQINEYYGIKRGYNLFEQDSVDSENEKNEETGTSEKKYKLKVKSDSETSGGESMPPPSADSGQEGGTPMETPSIEDVPAGEEGGAPEGEEITIGGEEGAPEGEEMPSEEAPEGEEIATGGEEDFDDEDIDEDEDPKKYIQKLTGRLGQKLRELSEVDPKLEKYVINSIISALHIDKMDKKDRMDVIKKFKKKKGMESMMKESYISEMYGMMSLDGPFNYEKLRGGFDENQMEERPKIGKGLRFKKHELNIDEKLFGNQHKIDRNKNGKIDAEDFRMLRSKDEKLYGKQHKLDRNKNGRIDAEDFRMLRGKDEGKGQSDREARIEDAIRRLRGVEKGEDDIKFRSSKDEMYGHSNMDELDVMELFDRNDYEPEVADPETETGKPLIEPRPRIPNPFEGDDDEDLPMPGPKMEKNNEPDYEIEFDDEESDDDLSDDYYKSDDDDGEIKKGDYSGLSDFFRSDDSNDYDDDDDDYDLDFLRK